MNEEVPQKFALIAGRGSYPLLLAKAARDQGARHIFAVAFKGETNKTIEKVAHEVKWVNLGHAARTLQALRDCGMQYCVMAGQIRPTNLFRFRPDKRAVEILKQLREKNAHSIFGAVVSEVEKQGLHVLPASTFMEPCMPEPGVLGRRGPNEKEQSDIELGLRVATVTSGLDVGQTVVMKDGVILAVEAFEGTDRTIRRAGRLGGAGVVVVKVAKPGHDMRFDIPIIGMRTMSVLKKVKARALAMQAKRCIILEKERVIDRANELGICLTAVEVQSENNG